MAKDKDTKQAPLLAGKLATAVSEVKYNHTAMVETVLGANLLWDPTIAHFKPTTDCPMKTEVRLNNGRVCTVATIFERVDTGDKFKYATTARWDQRRLEVEDDD